LQKHVPATVKSPPRQFCASVLTQLPLPATLPLAGSRLNPAGQAQFPSFKLPPSQTTLSVALRVVVTTLARQLPLAASRWALAGHTHCPDASLLPPVQGIARTGAGVGSDDVDSDGADFATQLPALNSCQGKHVPSAGSRLCSDCAIAGAAMTRSQQIEIASAVERRVMIEPLRHLEISRKGNLNRRGFARRAAGGSAAILCNRTGRTGG
jgi:hypothetical protein